MHWAVGESCLRSNLRGNLRLQVASVPASARAPLLLMLHQVGSSFCSWCVAAAAAHRQFACRRRCCLLLHIVSARDWTFINFCSFFASILRNLHTTNIADCANSFYLHTMKITMAAGGKCCKMSAICLR